MGRKEVLAERRAIEQRYYGGKLNTPEEVAQLFKDYTHLIWVYHQAGLVYDYYSDETTLNHEGSFKEVGGVTVTCGHTIPALVSSPAGDSNFVDIFCVEDGEGGYKFGQITTSRGIYPQNAYSGKGLGTGEAYERGASHTFCQCVVKKVAGRWAVAQEYLVFGEEVARRRKARSRPFATNILEFYEGPACRCGCGCEDDAEVYDILAEEYRPADEDPG